MVTWNMHYSLATRDQQQICRLHFNSLRQDPNVESLAIGQGPSAAIAEISVTFKEGSDQPRNRDLHALNLRFPRIVIPEERVWPAVQPLLPPDERRPFLPSSDEVRMTTLAINMSFDLEGGDSQVLSAEYSPMFEPIPSWVRINIWIRNKLEGNRYQVTRIVLADPSSIILHEWKTDPGLMVGVTVSYLTSDFEECEAPIEGTSAFARLLKDEDPF
jgi:hypothetical protein